MIEEICLCEINWIWSCHPTQGALLESHSKQDIVKKGIVWGNLQDTKVRSMAWSISLLIMWNLQGIQTASPISDAVIEPPEVEEHA